MMLLPILKGGSVAKEWQPISELMCSAPSSRCTSLIAEKSGRCGHLKVIGRPAAEELAYALFEYVAGIFSGHWQYFFADDARMATLLMQNAAQRLLDELGLALLDDQHRTLAGAELLDLFRDQWVGDIQDVERARG